MEKLKVYSTTFSIFNSFIAELAKQWMSFCRDGQNGVSKICVDGCDVVSGNSGKT